MSEIVHGIYFPFCTGAMMGRFDDAVHYGVAEMHVWRCHVNLGAEHAGTFVKLAGIHALKKVKVFLNRTVAIRRIFTGSSGSAFLSGNLLGSLVIHIGFSLLDKADGQIVKLGEIITGIVLTVAPVKAEPVYVLTNRVHILHILLHGVGIIKTQVASAAEFFSHTEIHAYCLGMADM